MGSFVTGGVIAGGTVGYAIYDKEFRFLLEDTIPESKDIFAAIDDYIKTEEQPPPKTIDISVPPSKLKVQALPPVPEPEIEKPPEEPPVEEQVHKPNVEETPEVVETE